MEIRTLLDLTFFPHSHGEALFVPTMLALIPVVLVHGTILLSSTLVGEVAAYGPLEETFAT